MNRRLFATLAAAALFFGSALPAQICGPFNVSTATTGPGCTPFAGPVGGPAPVLSAGLGLSPAGVCVIPFTAQAPFNLFALPRPVFLALGYSNPSLSLSPFGLPGCTLHTTLVAFLPMAAAGSSNLIYVSSLLVPYNAALVGTTVFSQSIMLPNAANDLAITNGIAVSL